MVNAGERYKLCTNALQEQLTLALWMGMLEEHFEYFGMLLKICTLNGPTMCIQWTAVARWSSHGKIGIKDQERRLNRYKSFDRRQNLQWSQPPPMRRAIVSGRQRHYAQ